MTLDPLTSPSPLLSDRALCKLRALGCRLRKFNFRTGLGSGCAGGCAAATDEFDEPDDLSLIFLILLRGGLVAAGRIGLDGATLRRSGLLSGTTLAFFAEGAPESELVGSDGRFFPAGFFFTSGFFVGAGIWAWVTAGVGVGKSLEDATATPGRSVRRYQPFPCGPGRLPFWLLTRFFGGGGIGIGLSAGDDKPGIGRGRFVMDAKAGGRGRKSECVRGGAGRPAFWVEKVATAGLGFWTLLVVLLGAGRGGATFSLSTTGWRIEGASTTGAVAGVGVGVGVLICTVGATGEGISMISSSSSSSILMKSMGSIGTEIVAMGGGAGAAAAIGACVEAGATSGGAAGTGVGNGSDMAGTLAARAASS